MTMQPGKLNTSQFCTWGAAGSSGGSINVLTAPAGSIYILDWINIIVRNVLLTSSYITANITTIEGATPISLFGSIVNAGLASALGTYSVFFSNLGIPVSGTPIVVNLIDNLGATIPTTVGTGLVFGSIGLKQFPYPYAV